ncbi:hypothetical protein QQY24_10520 [Streptomyces sp. TG1A-8]|uniref:hypothetical protein n=1 Tax=Streptomyces sp. TG1A-8 TaxID=3051385 RepID=UPI00265C41E8|nr:hypothetical protein [Streptomyces sp. TG1A-8]MDO0925830.1 hypothetical protein [Streptomyces sp. TG1A-8]
MNAKHWKRSAVVGSALVLALAPIALQPVEAAAAPSQTHVSAVESQRDYRQGYRTGFRDGYQDARDDCKQNGRGNQGYDRTDSDYARGYGDGYSSGFARAEHRYC